MRRCLPLVALTLFAWLTPLPAQAGSIPYTFFDGGGNPVPGTITATLDLYSCSLPCGTPSLLGHLSLGVGSDFFIVVPQAVVDSHAAWEAPAPHGNSPFGDWVFEVPGLNGLARYPFTNDPASLDDWCSNPLSGGGFVNTIFVMALRGNCAFSQKVTNIEGSYAVGAIIVNNIPGAGAQAMSLGALNPGIPVIGLSYERGAQISSLYGSRGLYIDFDARWDPDPAAVPEPVTLALLSGGLATLTAGRRLRRRGRAIRR